MYLNIPEADKNKKRIVIVGGGFAGLTLAKKINRKYFQVVLLDENNYHQFQPLLYQVAMAGLEPSAISFPFRKVFRSKKNIHFRMCKVLRVLPEKNMIETDAGRVAYDYLVLAYGSTVNYFGMKGIQATALPMKSVNEALSLRNTLLNMFERSVSSRKEEKVHIVIVGGGPTGVEISGALAEMKKYVLPRDYPDTNFSGSEIILIEAASRLLSGMSRQAADKALYFLQKTGVRVMLNAPVKDYVHGKIILGNDQEIETKMVIWTSGITVHPMEGVDAPGNTGRGNRLKVNVYNRMESYERIFAIGDLCLLSEEKYPDGHPQLAQVAIQQAKNLAGNFLLQEKGKPMNGFHYKDKGVMATIGKNKAVADLPFIHLQGFMAWVLWMGVHLVTILGVKNKLIIFLDWCWSYFSYDPSLRLIFKSGLKENK